MVEHGGAVHSYLPYSVHMPAYGEKYGIAYTDNVVVTGGPGIPREAFRGGEGWGEWAEEVGKNSILGEG